MKQLNPDKFRFTDHFFERWTERMPSYPFKNKKDLGIYIELLYRQYGADHIDGDFYLINNILVTISNKQNTNSELFITVYGTVEDNPILYNLLITKGEKGVRKAHREYGKLTITPNQ